MTINSVENRVSIVGEVSIGATISYINKQPNMPAVVLIMGTGKTDRDGNQKGFKTDFYKNIADYIASLGFVCVRYDKRGTYETTGDYKTAGLLELVKDAKTVVEYTKGLPYVEEKRVIVCGHSEGAQIATLLSQDTSIAGLVLLGGAATSMKDALRYQNQLAAKEFEHKKGILGALLRSQTSIDKTNRKVELMFQKSAETKKDRIFFGGVRLNANWVREHGMYETNDYINMLKAYGGPVLAITGTADLSADYKMLDEILCIPDCKVVTPKQVNHMLRKVDDDNSMLTVKKQYIRLAKQPMDQSVAEQMQQWLKQFIVN